MADDYLRRTAVTRLVVSDRQATLLDRTVTEWQRACGTAVGIGWNDRETRRTTLQSRAYDTIREQTDLGSQHAILATHQAAAAIESVVALEEAEKDHSVSQPSFTSDTVKYDNRTMTVFDDESASLATVENRIRCDLALPEAEDGYQYQYLDSEVWELTESTLSKRDGDYFLHLGFRRPRPEPRAESDDGNRTVLGVDLGIVNVATTSTAHFASGRELRHDHREYERRRGSLQQTGTESAHRTICEMAGRESRCVRDELHNVAADIVAEAVEHGCEYIAVENLRHIRDRMPPVKQFHQWAHRELVELLESKAAVERIEVVYVDPKNTSRTCPACGHTSESNRRSQAEFVCRSCGETGNADYVAAKNVGMRYVRRGLQSSRRTGDSRLALKSGTLSPDRGFVASA